jgi:hypothetical protein
MVKGMLAVLAIAGVLGTGAFALRSVVGRASETFDTLNEALADALPGKGKASARETAAWVERYWPGASHVRCDKAPKQWDYVCVFRSDGKGRLKIGVLVNYKQPIETSPAVRLRRQLPAPRGA